MEETEIWMPVKGYEGVYEVSHYGNVKRILKGTGTNVDALNPFVSNKYLRVRLSVNNVITNFCVHTLVLSTFNCPKPEGMECRHFDGNGKNNYIGNLGWANHQDNMEDKRKHGTIGVGEKNGYSKLSNKNIASIRELFKKGLTHKEIGNVFGVSRSTI